MRTIISHFYNEEYLLPWWLEHHKKYFDHGILVNYGSSDSSVEIIKDICPTWEIRNSKHRYWRAICCDAEIDEIEQEVKGWRAVLNTTEFLFGNYSLLKDTDVNTQYIVGCNVMVDEADKEFTDIKHSLIKERTYGLKYDKFSHLRRCRSIHNYPINYKIETGPGRHFSNKNTDEFFICWYGLSPFNEQVIKRKLQVWYKMWPGEPDGSGADYWIPSPNGFAQKRIEMYEELKSYQTHIEDLSNEINKYL